MVHVGHFFHTLLEGNEVVQTGNLAKRQLLLSRENMSLVNNCSFLS